MTHFRPLAAAILFMLFFSPVPAARGQSGGGLEKISDHAYRLQYGAEQRNCAVVATAAGVLVVDPPPEQDLPVLLEALRNIHAGPVRWVVPTDYLRLLRGAGRMLHDQGAAVIGSAELDRLARAAREKGDETVSPSPQGPQASPPAADPLPSPRFVFGSRMRLFPDDLEIRILAVKHRARTAGDVVLFVPSEKVVLTGDLYTPFAFPEIDGGAGEGSASGWIDGLEEVIRAIPVLKSAMAEPKPDPNEPPEEEKTLEELIPVVGGHGPLSNLQEMKDMLAAAKTLRSEAAKAVRAGVSADRFLQSSTAGTLEDYSNLRLFVERLFEELAAK